MKKIIDVIGDKFSQELKEKKEMSNDFDCNTTQMVDSLLFEISCIFGDRHSEEEDALSDAIDIELAKLSAFKKLFGCFESKYLAAMHCSILLNKRHKPYILYLHDFPIKIHNYEYGTVSSGKGSSYSSLIQLADKLKDKIPIISISVPSDDSALQSRLVNMHGVHPSIYLVRTGKEWLKTVSYLMQYAGIIYLDIENCSQGTQQEIELIKKLGYLDKTYCYCDNKDTVVKYKLKLIQVNKKNVSEISKRFSIRNKLPKDFYIETTCLWAEGNFRKNVSKDYNYIWIYLNKELNKKKQIHLISFLDLTSKLIYDAVLLENFVLIYESLLRKIEIVNCIPFDYRLKKKALLKGYSYYIYIIRRRLRRYKKNKLNLIYKNSILINSFTHFFNVFCDFINFLYYSVIIELNLFNCRKVQ
jgi:hypothetical protein